MKFRTWLKLRRKQQGENAVEHEEVLHARDGYRSAFETLQAEATRSRQEADGYRSAFESLQAEASRFRQDADGYRDAFEALRADSTSLRHDADGYRGAYEACSAELAKMRDERDRILSSLEKKAARQPSTPRGPGGRQICFMHIGKTAGTSLQHALFEAMKGAPIFHESLSNFDAASPVELAINDLVIGHFTHQHVAKLRRDRFLLTFLRDPVERVVSNYHFLRTTSPVSDYSSGAIEAARSLTLGDFIRCDDPRVRMVTENFQAKALAHDFRPEYQAKIADLRGEAERNLARFDFVGVVEHYEASVATLSRALGLELMAKKLNVNNERSPGHEIAQADIELIKRLNAVDHALHARAMQWFEARGAAARYKAEAISI
jgi:hypothetical protein